MKVLKRLGNWIKKNKLAAAIIAVLLLVVLFGDIFSITPQYSSWAPTTTGRLSGGTSLESAGSGAGTAADTTTTTTTTSQMVVKETTMSLVVKDVQGTADTIVSYAEAEGGFMTSTSISKPSEGGSATVIIYVPKDKLKTATEHLRSLALKVSSERLSGTDISETYADYETRIATLQEAISQLEAIRKKTTKTSELVSITNQILTLQKQVDSYTGAMSAMEDRVAYSKITVYLATDELSLPYEPSEGFRPSVVFKQAVRALLSDLYSIGRALIWVGVYGVFWVPALAIILVIRRKKRRRKSS
jgi:hypothetical protein